MDGRIEHKNNHMKEYLQLTPGEETFFARDADRMAHSNDYLFMAAVLRNWKRETRYLSVFQNTDGKILSLLEDRDGCHYHPVTGVPWATDGLELKYRLNRRTIKSDIRKGFYGLRTIIVQHWIQSVTIGINGRLLFDEGIPVEENLRLLDGSLAWKFRPENDFADHFIEHLREMERHDLRGRPDLACCPVDGPVEVIYGMHKSDRDSWAHLYGRQYALVLCPRCLGMFYSFLTIMS